MAFNSLLVSVLNISPQQYHNKGYQSNLRIKKQSHAIMLCNTRNTLKSQNMSKSEECNNLFKLFAVEGWRWHICIFIWVLCVNNGTCQYVNCQSRTYQPAEGNPVTVDDCKATPVISQPTILCPNHPSSYAVKKSMRPVHTPTQTSLLDWEWYTSETSEILPHQL